MAEIFSLISTFVAGNLKKKKNYSNREPSGTMFFYDFPSLLLMVEEVYNI